MDLEGVEDNVENSFHFREEIKIEQGTDNRGCDGFGGGWRTTNTQIIIVS